MISAIALSLVYWSVRNGIVPMPTSLKAKQVLLQALPKDLEGMIVDVGSGWGTLVFVLAKQYPACQVVGYETSPIPYWFSKLRGLFFRQANVLLVRKDFMFVDFSDCQCIVCYLYPRGMRALKPKLDKDLKPGCYVISNTFAVPGWQPIRVVEVADMYHSKIYLYQKKGNG